MKLILLFITCLLSLCCISSPPSEKGSYYRVYKMKDRKGISDLWGEEIKLYGIKNGMKVMDVGGSDAKLILPLALVCDSIDYCVEDINSVNFYWEAPFMALAKKNINASADFSLSSIIGTDSTIPAAGKQFDRIIVRETVHHFKYPLQMIREFKRLLASDGTIVVSEPTNQKKFKHCKLLEPKNLIDIFASEGLKLVSETKTKAAFIVYIFKVQAPGTATF